MISWTLKFHSHVRKLMSFIILNQSSVYTISFSAVDNHWKSSIRLLLQKHMPLWMHYTRLIPAFLLIICSPYTATNLQRISIGFLPFLSHLIVCPILWWQSFFVMSYIHTLRVKTVLAVTRSIVYPLLLYVYSFQLWLIYAYIYTFLDLSCVCILKLASTKTKVFTQYCFVFIMSSTLILLQWTSSIFTPNAIKMINNITVYFCNG